jgi:molybdopterin/thiamine biosynthesis adenylyltransferase
LSEKKVVVLGVGALGSEIADLLARAGIGRLMLIDSDTVAAGNTIRHALHLGHVGYSKAQALRVELSRTNPFSDIGSLDWRFGNSTAGPITNVEDAAHYRENDELVAKQLTSADLIVEASTVTSTGYLVSQVADRAGIPVVHAAVSVGAWGGRLLLQRHGSSGCLECLARHQEDGDGLVPPWAMNRDENPVVEKGCGQTTFTGPGFELASTASAGARIVVQALLEGNGYPRPDFDLATWEFRGVTTARPAATYTDLPRHSSCESCTV